MNLIYCQATNTGKNFYTKQDRLQFDLYVYPGNLYGVGDTQEGNAWIKKISGVIKTKEEAQAIIDVNYESSVTAYNAYKSSLDETAITNMTKTGVLKAPTRIKL